MYICINIKYYKNNSLILTRYTNIKSKIYHDYKNISIKNIFKNNHSYNSQVTYWKKILLERLCDKGMQLFLKLHCANFILRIYIYSYRYITMNTDLWQ